MDTVGVSGRRGCVFRSSRSVGVDGLEGVNDEIVVGVAENWSGSLFALCSVLDATFGISGGRFWNLLDLRVESEDCDSDVAIQTPRGGLQICRGEVGLDPWLCANKRSSKEFDIETSVSDSQ
jgi:hypothetical protein